MATHKPPMHVLTDPENWALHTAPQCRSNCVAFGEIVFDGDDTAWIYAGTAADGAPFLIPYDDEDRLDHIHQRLQLARSHHCSEGDP